MRTRSVAVVPLLLSLVLSACGATSGAQTGEAGVRRDPNVITVEEIGRSNATDAYDVVRTLRPGWLNKRGAMSVTQASDLVVYMDHARLGGPEVLYSIPVTNVVRMEFLDASSATQRWGTNHVHGAILVTSM